MRAAPALRSDARRTDAPRAASPSNSAKPMARLATGLLAFMACVYVVARYFEDRHPALGYLRAFAEASMVGGLADWFAVTALFRHPLGIPIPHTAIVPNNKDRIADTLGRFLRTNFLVPSVVARRLEHFDIAGAVARRLAQPTGGGKLRRGFAALARQMLLALDDGPIAAALRQGVDKRLAALDLATILAQLIETAIENHRHGALVDAGLRWAARALTENEEAIREAVRERAGWFMRLAGLDTQVSDRVIASLTTLVEEMAADPAHPMRLKATATLVGLAFDLKHDADTRAKVEAVKAEVLAHPALGGYLDGVWDGVKASLLRAADRPGGMAAGAIGQTLVRFGARVEEDARLRDTINGYARRAIVSTVAGYGDELVLLVSDTIRGWDPAVITDKLEGIVGRDLQYIRINGTVVGGLAGLAIHTVGQFL